MTKVKVLKYVKSDKAVVFKVPLHRTPVVRVNMRISGGFTLTGGV